MNDVEMKIRRTVVELNRLFVLHKVPHSQSDYLLDQLLQAAEEIPNKEGVAE